ncbi:MAG TPA: TRAP transporter substrate-binding protein DctP [Candidatus Sulfotelmatobacter sp.]|nr:TRAP transporter substrate-binding protein DctP [Candidatus Sulfotelmatobacter sp.]
MRARYERGVARSTVSAVMLWLLPAVLALGLPGSAGAAERLIFGHILDDSTAHHRNMAWAAAEIARDLKGRYELLVVPRGQLGITDAQVVEGFKTGTTQMAYLSFGHLVDMKSPLSIGAGPFVFQDFDHWQRFRDSVLYKELVAECEKIVDIKVFGLAYYGQRHVTTRTALAGAEGLKGLAIRVPSIPTMILTFRALGARPVPIPFKETYQALKEGIVAAQENPLPAIKAMRFYEVTPVINLTAHILDAQLVVMDGTRWRAIPRSDQAVLERVFRAAAERATEDVRREELELERWLAGAGATLHPVDRQPLVEQVRPFHRDGRFPWSGELYEQIQALR